MKARKLLTLFSISILSVATTFAQPTWVSGPTPTPKPITLDITFQLSAASNVYYVAYNYDVPCSAYGSSYSVYYDAVNGNPGSCDHGIISYSAGEVGSPKTFTVSNFPSNSVVTIFIVAQLSGGGPYTAITCLHPTTLPCPDITLFTFFGNTGDCVNSGATGMFQAAPLGVLPTGVLKGTTWTVDWGDGTAVWSYTSTADDNIPGVQLHTYANLTSCNYVGTWTVQNPCGKFANASNVFVVHGRDIPLDGDGKLQMEETTTHAADIVYVCEGKLHNIKLADISTWNCQNPVVPFPLIAKPNNSLRTIQFIYGQSPTGVVGPNNTITGNVLIAGVNICNAASGWDGPLIKNIPPPNPNTQSDVITIPATCAVGQRFYVYLKDWNKCNPYTGDPAAAYVSNSFIIEIIASPPAPIVTTPLNYCFGSVPLTISATPNLPGNTINWYADAGLTTLLFTGQVYTHGKTAVGTYNYWVTETSGTNGCEGPAAPITMNINPVINNNTVAAVQTICYNTAPTGLTGSAPGGGTGAYTYQWQNSADNITFNNIIGATAINYAPPALTSTTYYRRIVTSGPCSNTSPSIQITVYGNLTSGTIGTAQSICYNTAPVALTQTGAPTGGTGAYTYQWQNSPDNATWTSIGGATAVGYAPPVLTVNTYYRRQVTSGACGTVNSASVLITVYADLTAGTVGSVQTICYNTIPVAFTQLTAPTGATGVYTYQWQSSPDNVTWTSIGGATGVGYTSVALTANTYFRRQVTSGTCATVSSPSFLITVYANLTSGTIGTAQTICYNTAPAALTETGVPTGGTGAYTYQWQSSPDNATWTSIGGATAVGYAPPALTASTYYRRQVTSGACGTVNSASIFITVYGQLTSGTIGTAQSICYNTAPVALTQTGAPTGGTGAYTYQWQSSPDNATWTSIGGATAVGYAPPALTANTYYRRQVTSGTCGTVNSASILITVYANLTSGTIGTAQAICYNTAPAALTETAVPTGGTGAYTYQWQSSPDNATWTSIGGATAVGYAPPALTVATYYRRQVTSGSCGTVNSASILISINPLPTPVVSGENQPCSGNTKNYSTPAIGGHTYSWSVNNGTISGPATNDNVNIIWNVATGAGWVKVTETITATGCVATTANYAVNVNPGAPGAAGAITGPVNVCYGQTGVNYTIAAVANASSYVWTVPAGVTIASGQGTISVFVDFAAGAASPRTIQVYPHNGCGDGGTASTVVSIYTQLTTGTIGTAQTICYNTAPAALTETAVPTGGPGGYTYQWQSSPDNATWTSIGGATAVGYAPAALTASTYYRRQVTSGTCGTVNSASILITVYGNLTSGTIGTAQSICYNTIPAALTETAVPTGGPGGYTYQWQSSPDNATWTSIGGATAVGYAPATLTASTYYRRQVTSGTCGTVNSVSILITVYGNLTSGTIGTAQSICYNTAPVALTQTGAPTGGTGAYTYQWQSSPDNATWTSIGGATAAGYGPPVLTANTYYRRQVTSGTCGTVNSASILITVYANLTSGTIGTAQSICYNTAPAALTETAVPTGGTGAYTYQWQSSPDNATWTSIGGATAVGYAPAALTASTYYRRQVTSGTCGTVNSASILITVYANLTSGTIGTAQSICYNTAPAALTETAVPTGGPGGYTYQWQSSPDNATWTSIGGATAIGFAPPVLTASTYYRRQVTSGTCGTVNSASILITVYGNLTSGTIGTAQSICYNTAPAALTQTGAPTGGTGAYTYQWQSSPDNATWTSIGGATAAGYAPPALTASTYYRRQVTSGTCGTVNNASILITVYANLTSGTIGTAQSICYNTAPAALTETAVPTGGTGAYTYQWQSSPDNATWTSIGGATAAGYAPAALTASTYYRRQVTSGTCGTVNSASILITVYGNLTSGTIGTAQSICYNTAPAPLTETAAPTGGPGGYTYQWQSSPDNATWTGIGGATAIGYAPPALTANTYYRRQVTSGTCGTVNSASILISVNGDLTPGTIGTAQSICYNTAPAALTQTAAPTGGTGVYTYQWQSSPDNATWTSIGGATGVGYAPPALTASTYYRRQVTGGGSCGTVNSTSVLITVYPVLSGGIIASDQTICSGGDVAAFTSTAAASGGAGVFTYTWQYTTNLAAVAGDGNWTDIPASNNAVWDYGTLTTTTRFIRKAVEGTCSTTVYSNILLMTVSPALAGGTIGSNQTICYGADVPAFTNILPASGGSGVFTYTWQYTTNMAAVAGDGNWTDIPASNNAAWDYGTLTLQTKFIRKAVDISCTSPVWSNMITVSINPLPVTSAIAGPAVICDGATNKVWQVTNTAGSTYTWTVPASINRTSPQGLYFIIADAVPGMALPGDEITVRETFTSTTGCVGPVVHFPVTVQPTIPGAVVAGPLAVCQGDAGVVYSVPDNAGSTYSWVVPAGATITSNPALHSITVTFTMAGSGPVSVVETSGTVCTTIHIGITLTINPLPTQFNLTAPAAYCTGDPGVTITLSGSTVGVNYQLFKNALADGAPLAGTGSPITWANKTAATYYAVATNATTACVVQMNGTVVPVINIVAGGTIGSDEAICENTTPSAFTNVAGGTGGGSITYQWQSSLDGITFTDISGATSANYGSGPLAADTWFRRTAFSTMGSNVCSAYSNTIKITVNNFVAGSIGTDQTICEGAMPGASTSVTPTGDGVFSYQWEISTDGISYSDIGGAISETYTPGALASDTWYKRKSISTLLGVSCTKETNAVRISVINFTPGSINSDQTICEGGMPAAFTSVAPSGDGAFTYQWESSSDGTTFALIGAATSSTYGAGALNADTWYRRIVTSTLNLTLCTKTTNIIKVTVNNFVTGSIGSDQTICDGTAPAAFTSVTPTGDGAITYQWQSSADGVSYSNIPGATNEIYAPAAIIADTWYQRVVISTLGGSICSLMTNAIKVTVINFTSGTISAAQTICDGDIPAPFTSVAATGDGTFTYQWESSADGITFAPIGAATSSTYSPGALTADTWYRREATSTIGLNTCTLMSNMIKVTVNNFVPGSIDTDQTICENTAPSALTSVTPTGDGSFSYRWFSSPDGASFSVISGATSETYGPGNLAADTWYRREVTSSLNGKTCTAITNVVKITVNNFIAGSILSDQTICEGAMPGAFTSVIPTGDGTFTYQWKSSTDGLSYSNISGATSETYTEGVLTADTWYKRAVTSTLGTSICTLETAAIRVTVINFSAGSIGLDQTVCEGATPAVFTSAAPSGDGAFTYQWQNSADGTTFTPIVGATLATYAAPSIMADTWYRREVTSTLNITACVKFTNIIKVTVNNFVTGSIGSDQTICEGGIPAAFTSVTPTGDGTLTYLWQSSFDGVSYSNITGATSETYAPAALTADTWYRRQVTSTLNGNSCTLLTNDIKVTVNNFTPGVIGASQTICENDTPVAFTSTVASGDGTITYQWMNSADGATFAPIGGATLATYAPGALIADTWYKRQAISTLGLNICTGESNTIKVTVNNFTQGSIGSDQTICENTTPAALTSVAPTGDGALTYRWFSSPDGASFAVIPGAISETYAPGILAADTWYRREVTSTLSGKACTAITNTIKITVNNFVAGSIGSDQSICEGAIPAAFTSVTPTGDGAIGYQWQNSSDGVAFSNIAGATSETYTAVALIADTWYRRTVTSTLGANVCSLQTNIVKVTVINFTAGAIGTDQTICDGTAPAAFTSVAPTGDGVFTFQWQNSPDGVTFANIGTATSSTYSPGALAADAWYKRIVTSTLNLTPCTKETNIIKVTVNNFVAGSVGSDQTICEGDVPAAFTSVIPTGDGSFSYQWQLSSDGVSYASISGATSATYNAAALNADTWFRRQVTSTLNTIPCVLYTSAVKVTVNNFIPGSIGAAQTICDGDIPAALTSVAPSGDGTFTYQWESSPDGTTFASIGGATLATYAPLALNADTWYKRQVTSTLGLNTCTQETNTIKITVINFLPGSVGNDQTICENTAPTALTSVSPSGDGTFTYRWFDSADGVTFNVIAGATSETYAPGSLAADTWYRREVTSTLNGKSCVANTNMVRITVNNFIAGSIGIDQTICDGGLPAALTSVIPTGDGTFTYQWMVSSDGVAFSSIGGATAETYAPAALTSDTWYKRQVTSTMGVNTCMKETNAVRVSVINFNPGTTGSDQTICDGTAPAPFTGTAPSGDGVFTFLWENSIDGVTYNPIGGATAATYTSPAINVDTWFRRTTTSTLNLVSCILQSPAIKVTVNNFVPGTIAIDQTICEGAMPGAFTSVAATGDGAITYQWQSSLDGASFSNITGATSETYAPPALTADTWYRRAVTSTLSGVACTLTGNVVKVTVNNLTPGSIGTAQTICDGDVPVAFTSVAATADGAITYQWMSSADGISYAAIGGATSDTYGAGPTTQDTWFKRVVTSTLSGVPCTDESNTIKVTVNNFIPGSIGTDQTICDGAAASTLSSVTPTGDGIFTYRWFSSSDGVTFNLIIGAINETYYPGTLIADTWYRREVTSTLAGKSCVANTNIVRVTVNNFTAGSIGSDQTICSGSIPAALTSFTPTADGAITYQWKSSTDGVNYLNIIGATSELYTPGALTADTWYIRSVTSTLNLVPCTKETNAVRITVNNVIGGTIISDQTICKGSDPVTFFSVVHGTGDGAVTWQWKSSPDNITFTDVAGATALNFDPPVLLADTWYKRVTTSLLNTVSCSAESNIVKVTVNAVTGGTITANQTICFGSVPAPFGSSDDGTGSGSVTWQWLSSANNVIFSTIPGATLTTYAPGALLSTTYYKRVIISIENGVLCQNESNVIQVTVNPLPVAVLTGGETICASQSSILNVTMSVGTGPYTLNIQNLGLVPGYVSGADITVTPLATTTYTLLSVTDANGCIVNSPSANLMGSATVTVRTPAFITTSPVNKTICEYGVTSFTVVAGGTNITYQWYEDQGSGFNALTDAGIYFGSTSATLNLFGTTRTMDGYKYHVVVTNCTTPVTSADATLTVNTVPEITNQPKDSTICSTQNATFSVIATGTAVTYQWEVKKGALPFANVVNDANFGGAAASTLTITNAPGTFNNYIFRVKVGGVCGAPFYSNFVVLRVNVPPTITVNPVSQPICDAAGTVYFRGNGSGMIDSLRWQVNTGSGWNDIHDNAIYSGTMSQQLAVMNAPVGYNGYQFRLALKAVCANAYTNPAILTVNSNPVVTFTPASIPACGGIAQVLTPIITSGSGTWTQHTWTGDIGPLNNYFIMNPTFKTLLAATYNLNYRVKDSNGCYGNGDLAVVVDSPDATFTQDQVSGCTPLTVNFTKDMTGYTSFTWDYGDLSPVNTAVASPTHIYTNVTPSTIKYYTVSLTVVSAGGCTSTKTSMVTVYPAINATFTADFTSVCSGSTITYTALPGANTYAWDYGDGVAASGSHVASHTYTNFTLIPVVDTVKLVTTSFYGCVDNKKLTVTIMPVPAVSFTAAPVSQVWSALGNPVTITNTTPGTWTYEWKFGDGTTSAVQNPPVHTYNGIGTYTIRLTATNGVCTDSTKHDVIVTPLAPIASFAHVDGGCEPLYITLDNTSQNLISGTTYFWDFGDGNYSTQKNPTYTYQSSGDYTIKLTVTGPGGTSTYSQLVVVSVSPKAFFEVTPTIVFVNDQNVRLVDESTNAVSWVWDFGDGDTSKLKDPFHKYMEEGVYDINLLVTSADGCTDQYILSPAVTVQPAGVIRFASVFTPFLDGPQEPQAGHIPSDQMDNFFFPPIKEKVLNYKLQIFNRLGVLIFVTTDIDHPWNGYYKGKLCPQGVYVWFVEGKYATGKVFKKVGDITLLH